MADMIRDGRGKGPYLAGVNSDQRLLTQTVMIDANHYSAHAQMAYNISITQTPSGANTPFLYIKNTSTSLLDFHTISCKVSGVESIELYGPIVGTVAGTTVTPTNFYVGSGTPAQCTILAGNALTGITSAGSLIQKFSFPADNATHQFAVGDGVLLSTNSAIAFYAVTGSIALDFSVAIDFSFGID